MADTCGLGPCFRPTWLRRFATSRSFLIVYGLLGTIQAMAYVLQILHVWYGMKPAVKKETVGCTTKTTSGYTSTSQLHFSNYKLCPICRDIKADNYYFKKIGMLLDIVVWKQGRKLNLYEEIEEKPKRTESKNQSFQQLK
ncbi:hypothetical protein C0J52_25582 [Blattella germanica]|nr:hypothetical protein C0J52_25582 [Blattella germanica]